MKPIHALRLVVCLVLFVSSFAAAPLESGSPSQSDQPTTNLAWQPAVQVATGWSHTCAITSAGSVLCWGSNASGQLGNGTRRTSLTPIAVVGLEAGVKQLTAGSGHTCALTSAGAVKCWGGAGGGTLGNPAASVYSATPVDVIGLDHAVVQIAAGMSHTCALTQAGEVWCWGDNQRGELGDGTATFRTVPVQVVGLASPVKAIGAGENHTCAVTTAGGVLCWGDNQSGQLGNGEDFAYEVQPVSVVDLTAGVNQISAGSDHTCALLETGGLKCWGSNDYGELGAAGNAFAHTPTEGPSLPSGAQQVQAGHDATCALTNAGAVYCWGWNYFGQLGIGSSGSYPGVNEPVLVSGLGSGVGSIAAVMTHTCAVLESGAVRCWGRNLDGQVGDGTTTQRAVPIDVVALASDGPGFSISGRMADPLGQPVPGVRITASKDALPPATAVAETDGNGQYTLAGLPAGDYTLTPAGAGVVFEPARLRVTVQTSLTGIQFTGTVTACDWLLGSSATGSHCQEPATPPFLYFPIGMRQAVPGQNELASSRILTWYDHSDVRSAADGKILGYDGSLFAGSPTPNPLDSNSVCYQGVCSDGSLAYDIFANEGASVMAAADGIVLENCYRTSERACLLGPEYGVYVVVGHANNRYATVYANLGSIVGGLMGGNFVYRDPPSLDPNATLRFTIIGTVGGPGKDSLQYPDYMPHLRFQVLYNAQSNQEYGWWKDAAKLAVDPFGWQPTQPGTPDPSDRPNACLWLENCPDPVMVDENGATLSILRVNLQVPGSYAGATVSLSRVPLPAPVDSTRASLGTTFAVQATQPASGTDGVQSQDPIPVTIDYNTLGNWHLEHKQAKLYRFDSGTARWVEIPTTVTYYPLVAKANLPGPGIYDLQAAWVCANHAGEPTNDQMIPLSPLRLTHEPTVIAGGFDEMGDKDYYPVFLEAGHQYVIQTRNLAPEVKMTIEVWNADGQSVAARSVDLSTDPASSLTFTPVKSSLYFIRIGQRSGATSGCARTYELVLQQVSGTPLPTATPTATATPTQPAVIATPTHQPTHNPSPTPEEPGTWGGSSIFLPYTTR